MHIVFQAPDYATLLKSFDLDETLRRDIILIRDDYSIGPLQNIKSAEGWQIRKQWYGEVYQAEDRGDTASDMAADALSIKKIKDELSASKEAIAWIWVAPNEQDVCGYYRMVSELKDFAGQVFVLHLNNLPFLNEKGAVFYPENLFEIPAKEFLKAKKLARPVTLAEFETDPDEWEKICASGKTVRTWEGAQKLALYPADHYDKNLLGTVTDQWQRASKVINQFLSKTRLAPSDDYLHWRIREMVKAGTVEGRGELKNLKEFEIRKANSGETEN